MFRQSLLASGTVTIRSIILVLAIAVGLSTSRAAPVLSAQGDGGVSAQTVPFTGCGTLIQGTECVLFRSDDFGTYLLQNRGGFTVGDRVFVSGQLNPSCFTPCLQGNGCIVNNVVAPCFGRMVFGTLELDPSTLNLSSNGQWVTASIELDGPCDASQISVPSVRLNELISPDQDTAKVGDRDSDGRIDLTLKFRRADLEGVLLPGEVVPIQITGILAGCPAGDGFFVQTSIRVIQH